MSGRDGSAPKPGTGAGNKGDLIAPHGGNLVNRRTGAGEAKRIAREAGRLPRVVLNRRQQTDLELIASGAYSPLDGFLGREDFESVVNSSRLASGAVWTIPVVIAVEGEVASRVSPGARAGLLDPAGAILGILDVTERHRIDREDYARKVFRTTDRAHPGVRRLFEEGDWILGGAVTVLRRSGSPAFPKYQLDPAETRVIIRRRGWNSVVGFQTRNPIHRAHEFLLKSALEIFDALLIQPLIGETRGSDIPAGVRLRCYEVLLEGYYPRNRTLLAVLPAVMRFAGPREAVFHALIRKNYGCTHFIVGRDHAGLGDYYGPYDAHKIFDEFLPEEIGIAPLCFEHAFYCTVCQGMASSKTCPHPASKHLTLSGTRVREMLARREIPPPEFTRPEVARVLMETFDPSAH
ncbi:MAG: sulfate adenylyltransferase [Acidobacteria bacterium]|nr:sulfate adenylyltransferase [Acidobacteriota bacterium]